MGQLGQLRLRRLPPLRSPRRPTAQSLRSRVLVENPNLQSPWFWPSSSTGLARLRLHRQNVAPPRKLKMANSVTVLSRISRTTHPLVRRKCQACFAWWYFGNPGSPVSVGGTGGFWTQVRVTGHRFLLCDRPSPSVCPLVHKPWGLRVCTPLYLVPESTHPLCIRPTRGNHSLKTMLETSLVV